MRFLIGYLLGLLTGWISIVTLSLMAAASKADRYQEAIGRAADERDAFEEIRRRLEEGDE